MISEKAKQKLSEKQAGWLAKHPAELSVKVVRSGAYWRALAKGTGLHLAKDGAASRDPCTPLPTVRCAALRKQLIEDGFFTLNPHELVTSPRDVSALCAGAERLNAHGWPATMLLMYDEAWSLARRVDALMRAVSGCALAYDTLAWRVDPGEGQSGFAPHRDRQPADVPCSFQSDGTPRYATCWIALSEATVDNSCLYIVPRAHDPGYDAGDDHSPDALDPLLATLRSDAAVQAIRACPLPPGGCLVFSHRIMHWGSQGRPSAGAPPRVSISFGCSDSAFEEPYLFANAAAAAAGTSANLAADHNASESAGAASAPPAAVRVALAAAQLIGYHERFAFGAPLLRLLARLFRSGKAYFTPSYYAKIAHELRDACVDRQQGGGGGAKEVQLDEARPSAAAGTGCADESDEMDDAMDDAMDEALEAMLEAQMEAADNLYDDFDDYADGEVNEDEHSGRSGRSAKGTHVVQRKPAKRRRKELSKGKAATA